MSTAEQGLVSLSLPPLIIIAPRSLLPVRCDNQNPRESAVGALRQAACALLSRGPRGEPRRRGDGMKA